MAKLQIAFLISSLVVMLLVDVQAGEYYREYRRRREIPSAAQANNANGQWDQKLQGKGAENFKPVTSPQSFDVNVADRIQGANQLRHETWDKGTMTGMYSQPIGNGRWQIVNYVADDKGFRILSTKEVDESELSQGQVVPNQQANVDVKQNGDHSSWSITADQLAKAKKVQANNIVKQRRDMENQQDKDKKDKDAQEKKDRDVKDKDNKKSDKDSAEEKAKREQEDKKKEQEQQA